MHVAGGERRAVMELDALADLEREGLAAVGRLRHLRAQVADELVLGGILRIGPDQRAIEWGNRVDQRERRLLVAVEARRLVGHDEFEYPALLGRLGLGRQRPRRHGDRSRQQRECGRPTRSLHVASSLDSHWFLDRPAKWAGQLAVASSNSACFSNLYFA